MSVLESRAPTLTKAEQEARIAPIIVQAYRRMLAGTVAEAAALAYTPSGPSIDILEDRIREYRRKARR